MSRHQAEASHLDLEDASGANLEGGAELEGTSSEQSSATGPPPCPALQHFANRAKHLGFHEVLAACENYLKRYIRIDSTDKAGIGD